MKTQIKVRQISLHHETNKHTHTHARIRNSKILTWQRNSINRCHSCQNQEGAGGVLHTWQPERIRWKGRNSLCIMLFKTCAAQQNFYFAKICHSVNKFLALYGTHYRVVTAHHTYVTCARWTQYTPSLSLSSKSGVICTLPFMPRSSKCSLLLSLSNPSRVWMQVGGSSFTIVLKLRPTS